MVELKEDGGRRNLVGHVVDSLRADIRDGAVKPGDKLPSEARLTARFGVSRTVVREAIAGLRADGLVVPRQGAGVFVQEPPQTPRAPFQIPDYERISSVLEMLELRVAVEMEAAALAARRRSPQEEEAVLDAAAELRRCIAAGEPTMEADLAFHLAICDATNNPRFREFLEVMGLSVIPRAALDLDPLKIAGDYLERIAAEHDAIADAISAGDPDAARQAMQGHLRQSMNRYRQLVRHNH